MIAAEKYIAAVGAGPLIKRFFLDGLAGSFGELCFVEIADDFQDNAIKGKWMVVPTVTDENSLNNIDKKLIDPDHLDPEDMKRELGL